MTGVGSEAAATAGVGAGGTAALGSGAGAWVGECGRRGKVFGRGGALVNSQCVEDVEWVTPCLSGLLPPARPPADLAQLGDVQFYEQCQCSRGRRTLTPSCRRPRWRPWRRPTSPTATTCRFAIVQDNLAGAELSDAQLETMLYAFQRFGRRLPDDSRAPASC
ncbi:hypothetical protein CHLRE_02g095054v5 [Chlamydomonas reinhardtii]|uniref:Uncharacterized protein n=1 Tax=Chlamydomonas reinhardtii TaxID=3055 RepID=A0A2K3E1K9_CHLRE|nr:uncharacterized protein CHLRE_02g095054v5 [Chlamydomonas reinhardtii]XP_042927156.1 uncharacterized protein CHLRE_02g095054v5 [Chlamydomonas reinhardtii]PNW86663.1 hypothetical protein CHLRE_02g095054v5 [Chlamydomonas reinhardtii]PNW86665.1 hypothetical protein CHLRE_02g095054v5 [Chlamydomonas reinhardtii]